MAELPSERPPGEAMYMQPVFSKQDEPDWFEQTFGRCPHGSLATYPTSSTTI
jgi:hypothetical protein